VTTRVGGDSAETKLIQIALTLHGWSMTELAKRAGLARTYVSEIVHGRICRPTAQGRIARVLGMGTGNRTDQANRTNRSNEEKE